MNSVPPLPAKRILHKDRFKPTTDGDDYTSLCASQTVIDNVYDDLRHTSTGTTPFQAVCFQLNLSDVDSSSNCDTAVCRIVSSYKLPFIVKVKRKFTGLGSEAVRLQEGDILMFHFIGRLRRVLATNDSGRNMLLPIQAKQVYDILPSEQRYDDKIFRGTKAVIEAKPLPNSLRIVEAHYSIFSEESQEVGDVMEISHVERRHVLPLKTGVTNRVLIGKYNGNNTFAFPESMTCSTYSAMISEKPCTLSEILEKKYPFPFRIRTPDKSVYLLKEYRDDIVVIASHFNSHQVIAIPVTCQIDVEKETNLATERLLHGLLPSIYPLLNCSFGIIEIGRSALPEDFQQIPQPIETILNQWKDSYEGQKFIQLNSKAKNKYSRYEEKKSKNSKEKIEAEQFPKSSVPPERPPKPSPRQINTRNTDDATDKRSRPLPNVPPGEDLQQIINKKEKEIETLLRKNEELRDNYEKLEEEMVRLKHEYSQLNGPQDRKYFDQSDEQSTENDETVGVSENAEKSLSSPTTLLSATVEGVGSFLKDLGFDDYVPSFQEELVNGELLVRLDEDILTNDIGMKKIQARRLMLEVSKRLRNEENRDDVFEAVEHQDGTHVDVSAGGQEKISPYF